MIDHLYPISYLGGSGGSFLSGWLNQAAYRYPLKLDTITGNAHLSNRFVGFSIFSDQTEIVESLRQRFTDEQNKPFIGCHIIEDSLLLSNFTKSTKITYEQADILEIAINFCSKNANPDTSSLEQDIVHRLESTKQLNARMAEPLPETEQSTNISWKLLLYGDSNELVSKLAKFYSIEPSKFDLASLVWWRKLAIRNIANAPTIKIGDAG